MYLKKYDSECNFFPGDSFSQWENNFSHWPLLWSCVHELYQRTGASSRVVDIKHDLKNITSFCQRWPHTHTHTRTQHVFQKKKLFLKFFWLFFFEIFWFFLKISKNHIFRHFNHRMAPARARARARPRCWGNTEEHCFEQGAALQEAEDECTTFSPRNAGLHEFTCFFYIFWAKNVKNVKNVKIVSYLLNDFHVYLFLHFLHLKRISGPPLTKRSYKIQIKF